MRLSVCYLTWAGFLVTVSTVLAVPWTLFKIRDQVESIKRQRILEREHQLWRQAKIPHPEYGVQEFFIEQTLDHFDAAEEGTYKQRVFVNERYWRPGGPVFLYIGGEGGLSSYSVLGGEHVELAEQHQALLFGVEHRYYGLSLNDDSLLLENMRFLSSQQALADLASFYDNAVTKYNLTTANTWICFGGSYPGALSAWFRLKYPHIVYGAIASSAPVEAQLNFEGYNDVVAASLSDPVVQGSKRCLENVRQAFQDVGRYLAAKEFTKVQKDFVSCNDISSHDDTVQFVGDLAGIIMGIIQYNNQMASRNVKTLCECMTNSSTTPYEALVAFNRKMYPGSCSDNSWSEFIASLSNTTVDKRGVGVGMRQWIYQTCTQFGYYQTCDENTTCPFSSLMDLESNTKICNEVFEISSSDVEKRIRFTNDFYGSNRPKGSRIVFVNGSIDPWHALGVLKNQTAEEIAIFIDGSSHCQNMDPDSPSETPAIRAAKKEISSIVAEWLFEAGRSRTDFL